MMRTHNARCAAVSTRIAIERPAPSCISNVHPCSRAAVPGAASGAVMSAGLGAVLGAIGRRVMARI
jgi:hypothetical protein